MSTLPANYIECEQVSAEWFQARCGCLTSSRIAAVRKRKNGEEELAVRRNLRFELVCERLTGNNKEHYVSLWMKEGKEKEPLARAAYELAMGTEIQLIGFVHHPSIKWAGCSPDGLVGKAGMVEFKCPKVETHLRWMIDGEVPEEYRPQMHWQLANCPEREWNDFVSYCPELPKDLRKFQARLLRKDQHIRHMEQEARPFLSEVEEMLAKIKSCNKTFLTDGLIEDLEKSVELAQDRESFGVPCNGRNKL